MTSLVEENICRAEFVRPARFSFLLGGSGTSRRLRPPPVFQLTGIIIDRTPARIIKVDLSSTFRVDGLVRVRQGDKDCWHRSRLHGGVDDAIEVSSTGFGQGECQGHIRLHDACRVADVEEEEQGRWSGIVFDKEGVTISYMRNANLPRSAESGRGKADVDRMKRPSLGP